MIQHGADDLRLPMLEKIADFVVVVESKVLLIWLRVV